MWQDGKKYSCRTLYKIRSIDYPNLWINAGTSGRIIRIHEGHLFKNDCILVVQFSLKKKDNIWIKND